MRDSKTKFKPKDELDLFCSQDCKEEALAELETKEKIDD
jgi:hypothetical protein